MPSQRITPATGEIYHVYNRGVEKRTTFSDDADYVRFIHDIFEFNDVETAPDFSRRYKPRKGASARALHAAVATHSVRRKRKSIVEVLAFCLMDNHYHLLLRQVVKGGIPLFMKKLGGGYTNAFNLKHERVGALFQGKYKLKHVDKDDYLRQLVCYIHFNPLKFVEKLNEKGGIDIDKTWMVLKNYRWSSHRDYIGEDNFGSVINKNFILQLFGSASAYQEFALDWLRSRNERISAISTLTIDSEEE